MLFVQTTRQKFREKQQKKMAATPRPLANTYNWAIVILVFAILVIIFAIAGVSTYSSNAAPFVFVCFTVPAVIAIIWSSTVIARYNNISAVPPKIAP